MRALTPNDRRAVVVGRPLPFSIYAADQKLLLACGHRVPNEFVKEGLLRSGALAGNENEAQAGGGGSASSAQGGPLADLQNEYQHTTLRSRIGFRMERVGSTLVTRVIGVSDDGKGLIFSSPASLDGTPYQVSAGDTWTFRAMYATAAVRFQSTISQVSEVPFRFFSVSKLDDIDRRSVRAWPRVPTSLWTARSGEIQRVITDLSVGGARVAARSSVALQQGQSLLFNPSLPLATGPRELSLDASVLNLYGRSDANHQQVDFYGVRFEKLSELDRLVLHAYVQEQLSTELDRLWHVLTISAAN